MLCEAEVLGFAGLEGGCWPRGWLLFVAALPACFTVPVAWLLSRLALQYHGPDSAVARA